MLSQLFRSKELDKFAYAQHEAHRREFFRSWKRLPHETQVFNEEQYDRWLESVRKECGGHYPMLHSERTLRLGRQESGLPSITDLWLKYGQKLGLVHQMDGAFYGDLREPHIMSDVASVTLAVTNKALYPVGAFPFLGGQYFARPGKKLHIRAFGRMTSAATPTSFTFAFLYGTGADANGISIVASAAITWIANQASMSWFLEAAIHCRLTGSVGTLFGTGRAHVNVAAVASTNQPILLPATAPAVSAACDLTAANVVSLQMLRAGSTVETAQVHDLEVIAKN